MPTVAMCGTLGIVPLTVIGLGLLLMQLRFGRPANASVFRHSRSMIDAGKGVERFSVAGERRDAAFLSGRG